MALLKEMRLDIKLRSQQHFEWKAMLDRMYSAWEFIPSSVRYVRPVKKSRTKTALILTASTLFANLIQDDTAVLFQEFIRLRKAHQFVLPSMTEMGLILRFMKSKVWKSENQFYFC